MKPKTDVLYTISNHLIFNVYKLLTRKHTPSDSSKFWGGKSLQKAILCVYVHVVRGGV